MQAEEEIKNRLKILDYIRQDLPSVPEELHEAWLYGHYRDFGRPINGQPIPWLYGGNHHLEWLQALIWERVDIKITPPELYSTDLLPILGFLDDYKNNRLLHGPRVAVQISILERDRLFPVPIALKASQASYRVLDANHRLAAYFHMRETAPDKVEEKQPVWVAK